MRIIGISGRKQSGKNTSANFICGHILKSMGMVQDFKINGESGSLEIKTFDSENNIGWGILDLLRKDSQFVEYAERELWPYVKIYHFADKLKEICQSLFGLSVSQVYGTDLQKNEEIDILWDNVPQNIDKKTGKMTAREFMEYFGTRIVRKIKHDAWNKATINKIISEKPEIALIPDVRFANEVELIQKHGGVVIRLTRNIFKSEHECERSLDSENFDWNKFNIVIDNNKDVDFLCSELNKIKHLWEI